MRESLIEGFLRDKVREAGGRSYKFVSPGNNGVPDRIVLMPGGRVYFVEVKAPGRKPTELQKKNIDYMRSLGHWAGVIDSKAGVLDFIAEIKKPAI